MTSALSHFRSPALLWTLTLALPLLHGCGKAPQQTGAKFRMGEKMQTGPFVYSVLEAKWVGQLGEAFRQRIPEHRFLLLRLTITNSGGQANSVPLLSIEDGKNNKYQELQDGEGVPNWMGLLRTIPPAQTEEGWILFDAPPNRYSLRVTDGDAENEKTLLIDIPLTMDANDTAVPSTLPPQ